MEGIMNTKIKELQQGASQLLGPAIVLAAVGLVGVAFNNANKPGLANKSKHIPQASLLRGCFGRGVVFAVFDQRLTGLSDFTSPPPTKSLDIV